MSTPEVSVILIARNEAATISQCIESVLKDVEGREAEILLVDSASTDETVSMAARYPVRIIRFDQHPGLCPSAGRYVGTHHSTGRYVAFLDGDMVLIPGWIEHSIQALKDPAVGGVSGRLYWVRPGESINRDHVDGLPMGVVNGLGGGAVYRREVLEQCGTFNPSVKGEEERELAYRLRARGLTVVRLDVPMAYHIEKSRDKAETTERARYYFGIGQVLRTYFLRRLFWILLRGYGDVFAVLAVMFLTVGALCYLVVRGVYIPAALLAAAAGCVYLLLVALRGWYKVLLFFRFHILVLTYTLRGAWDGIRDPREFSIPLSIIKD